MDDPGIGLAAAEGVLTLVAPQGVRWSEHLDTARRALIAAGARALCDRSGAAGVFDPAHGSLVASVALDLGFTGLDPQVAQAVVAAQLGNARIDLLAQSIAERPRALLVADLESTVIENEMLDEMAAHIGRGPEVAAITAQAMRGELDFEASLEARLRWFQGQPRSLLDVAASAIRLSPGARTLLAGVRAAGITSALVSSGFHHFADPIAQQLGFDQVFANRLEIVDGRLTGRAVPPILGRDAKRQRLRSLCAELAIDTCRVIAVGDGANDLAMLAAAGLGIAYRAKPAVRQAARASIDHTGLDSLLFFLGLVARSPHPG